MRRISFVAIVATLLVAGCTGASDTVTPIQFPDSGTVPDTSTEPIDTTVPTSETSTPASAGDAAGKIHIVVDGWSKLSMANGALQWSGAGQERPTPVALRVASASEIADIAARDPRAIEQLMARLVTADPTLACTPTGCTTASGPVPVQMLSDLRTSPVLGGSYTAWGIQHGVWIGDIPVDTAVLSYGNTSIDLSLATPFDPALLGEDPELVIEETGIRVIGVALGAVFPLYAEWLDGERLFSSGSIGGIGAGADPAKVDPRLAFQGLGTPMDGIEGLGAAQLTWRTSPTTGCGAGIGCVPGSIASDVRVIEQRRTAVCSGDLRSYAEFVSLDVKITYDQPTHQFGMWSGSKPDGSFGERPHVMWITAAPLVVGATHQHHAIIYLYDVDGLADMVGRISDHAVDTQEDVTFRYGIDDVGRFFGGTWSACQT